MMNLPFKELQIWQKSMLFVRLIYEITELFPQKEQFSLTAQLRRASISVPSNIAEGSQRGSDKEFAQFISISKGSLAEVQTQCIIAQSVNYISADQLSEIEAIITELQKMLYAFHKTLIANR